MILVKIKDVNIEADFSIRLIADIARYQKFYEPQIAKSFQQWVFSLEDESEMLDTVVNLLFYKHAIEWRKKGMTPLLEWGEVAEWVLANQDEAQTVFKGFLDSAVSTEQTNEVKEEVLQGSKKKK
jgi:hypothetical protein